MDLEISESTKGQYSIQLASRISGVGVHTIRAWEKRYKAVTPDRNASGRREYSDKDIERLTILSELCTLGHSIGKIAGLPTGELKILLEKLGRQVESIQTRRADLEAAVRPLNVDESLKSLIMALRLYKLDVISHEINKLKLTLTPRQLALDIISPLLQEVGRSVHEGGFSISQEHALSAILKFHMGHILFRGPQNKVSKPHKIVLCAPEGDYHEFGILQAALLCNHYGIPYFFLGPNLPVDSLMDAYQSLEANMILVGSTVVPEGKDKAFVDSYMDSILRTIGDGHLLVGGNRHLNKEKFDGHSKATFFDSMIKLDNYLKTL